MTLLNVQNQVYAKQARQLMTTASNAIEEAYSYIKDITDEELKGELIGEFESVMETGNQYHYSLENEDD